MNSRHFCKLLELSAQIFIVSCDSKCIWWIFRKLAIIKCLVSFEVRSKRACPRKGVFRLWLTFKFRGTDCVLTSDSERFFRKSGPHPERKYQIMECILPYLRANCHWCHKTTLISGNETKQMKSDQVLRDRWGAGVGPISIILLRFGQKIVKFVQHLPQKTPLSGHERQSGH